MQIVLLFPNKLKPNEMVSAETLYLKRLKKYKVIMDEYRCINRKKSSANNRENDKYILNKIKKDDILVVCDERGKIIKTMELVNILNDFKTKKNATNNRLIFLIGGPYGLSDNVRNRADMICSLSGLILAGSVARLVLLENLYRCFMIIDNHPYHNN